MKLVFIGPHHKTSEGGFLSIELLLGSMAGLLLIVSVLWAFTASVGAVKQIMENIEIAENGRFLRQVLAYKIRFAKALPVTTSDGSEIRITGSPSWIVSQKGRQLYKKLSDGQYQPYTGNVINSEPANYGLVLSTRKTFISNTDMTYYFQWQMQPLRTAGMGNWGSNQFVYTVQMNITPYCVMQNIPIL